MVENVASGRLLIGGSPRAGTAISCGNTTTHLINKALERCLCNGDFSTVIASWTAQRVIASNWQTTRPTMPDVRWALEWRNPTRVISAMLWPFRHGTACRSALTGYRLASGGAQWLFGLNTRISLCSISMG